jgi:hypothetical protein
MQMHIDQARFLEQLNTRRVKPACPDSPPLFGNPIAQTQVVAQASVERGLLREPYPPLKPLHVRFPRPSRQRLQQRIKLRIRPTTATATMNPHPELETVVANIGRRYPRGLTLANVHPQVRQCFIPERARRPDRPQIVPERLPEHLMTLQPLSQTRAQTESQRKAISASIPPRDRDPAVLYLEPFKAPQEVFIDRTIIDVTGTPSRDIAHAMIMALARANSPHSCA